VKRRRLSWAILLVLASASRTRAEEEDYAPEPIGASVTEQDGVTLYEAILPGDLVDWARMSGGGGDASMVLLATIERDDASEGAVARQVWLWSPGGSGVLSQVGGPLSDAATHVMTLPGEKVGQARILVAAGPSLLGLGDHGEWVEVFTDDFDIFPVRDQRGGPPREELLLLRSLGAVQALRINPGDAVLRTAWQLDLPLMVDREWGGLRLETPPVSVGSLGSDSPLRLMVGPEVQGMRRIRSTLIEADGMGAPEVAETWNMLSSLEEVEESWYVEYAGAPALVVTTLLADKHGVFEKKKLRLFSLTADRTRAGSGPLLQTITRTRNWYRTCAGIADVNGDALDDVVSAQPKGLGAGTLWVEAHLGSGDGRFASKPRGSEIAVEEGEVCSLAMDVTGDPTVDLVVIEGGSVLVFPLVVSSEARAVVDPEPRFRVSFETLSESLRPFDPADRHPSRLVVQGRTRGKRQSVRLIQFP
jgi:hypothetical protein